MTDSDPDHDGSAHDGHAGRHEEAPPPETDAQALHRRRRNRGFTALIGVLLLGLGFALAVQLRTNSSTDALSGLREDDLARILADQNSRVDRLQQQIADLRQARQRLSDSGDNTAEARREAQQQADALAILTGTAPAHGPGVRITVTDPQHALRSDVLLDLLEELRGAGAEVVQFGSDRVSTSSAFTESGGAVFLDGTVLDFPLTVLAIGDPQTIDTALNITDGVVYEFRSVPDAGITITQSDSISITATRPIPPTKYAKPGSK